MKALCLCLFLCVDPAVLLGSGCYPSPNPPVGGAGCKRMVPICICDEHGRNCGWIWECET